MKKGFAIILIFLCIFTSGCIEKKSAKSTARDCLVYNIGKFPEDLLMLNTVEERPKDLLLAMFEGLIRTDEKGEIVPALASKWIISKDGITYTFKIREEAYWSDGTSIIAQDFVDFFSGMLKSKEKNMYAEQLYYIFGAEDYRKGKSKIEGVAIRATDSKTLEIRLNEPCSYFLDIISQPIFSLRKINSDLGEYKTEYNKILYSGPFKIENLSDSGEMTIIKNERYWDREAVKSDKVIITSIEDSEKALASFETSKIDILAEVPLSESSRLISEEKAIAKPIQTGAGIVFNLRSSISGDLNFRNAISHIVDRDDITENVLHTIDRTAETYVPVYNEDSQKKEESNPFLVYESDVNKSKGFLSKSKYDKKQSIKFIYLEDIKNRRICERIAERMEKLLGVRVETIGCSLNQWNEVIKKGEYDMAKIEYSGLFNDSMSFLEQWNSSSSFNVYGYQNAQYDDYIQKAKFESDKTKRKELLIKCQSVLVKDVPVIPIYFNTVLLCQKANVDGVVVTQKGNVRIDRMYIKTPSNEDANIN